MSNLKKIVALALVFAFAFTMFAAAATDFTDADKITQTEAVGTLEALGIMKGYPSGAFDPDKIVTRAEMAKMIYVLRNGGKDDGATYFQGSTFLTDIAGHWAEGYINYCYSLGIVSGTPSGTFLPDNPVTGLEAAKMLLVCLGYDSERDGFVGNAWKLNVASCASSKGLFTEYTPNFDTGAPRQFAAQMIYNALSADTVAVSAVGILVDGPTLGNKYMDLQEVTGYLVSAGNLAVPYTNNAGALMAAGAASKTTVTLYYANAANIWGTQTWSFETDASLVGQEVTLLYKNDAKNTVYNIYATSKNNVADLNYGDITVDGTTTTKFKYSGYAMTDNTQTIVVTNNTPAAAYATNFTTEGFGTDSGYTVKLIDNNNDGKYEYAFKTEAGLNKISAIGSDSYSLVGTIAGTKTIKDSVLYEGYAKDDIVFAYTDAASGKTILTKAEPVEVTIGGFSGTSYMIDGALVKQSAQSAAQTAAVGLSSAAPAGSDVGKTIKIYKQGKYWIGTKSTAVAPSNYCMQVANAAASGYNTQIKVLLADNTLKTYTVDGDSSVKPAAGTGINTMYTYTITDAGNIKLKALDADGTTTGGVTTYGEAAAAKLAYDNTTKIVTASNCATAAGDGNYKFASDSVVFVMSTTAHASDAAVFWKAYKGSEISADLTGGYDAATQAVATSYEDIFAIQSVSGVKYITMAKIITNAAAPSTGESDKMYGFITSAYVGKNADNKDTHYYTIWDGTKSISAEIVDSTPGNLVATKSCVQFSFKSGSDTVLAAQPTVYPTTAGVAGIGGYKVVAINGNDLTVSDGTSEFIYALTSDTKIIYINKSAGAGVETGSIVPYDTIADKRNVVLTIGAPGSTTANKLQIVAIFVDINNNIE